MAEAEMVDTREEAAAQELAPLMVRAPLAAYLDAQGLGSGAIEAERVGEGHSNVTYLVRRGDERFVLRRPPRPPLPPSAHDVLREARLLSALEGTSARAPAVLAACDDESILGVPFYVMEEMHGTVITTDIPADLDSPQEREAVFDWELATIGDPLADVGYLTATWVQDGDPADTSFSALSAVTRLQGFPTREQLVARYEQGSGRSVEALDFYQALALWKAAVFMEGNYKRFLSGSTDDSYLGLFDEGVPKLAERARELAGA